MCQFVIGPLTQNREVPKDSNLCAAHAWHVLPPFFIYLFWELNMPFVICYVSLPLFFLSQFHYTFLRECPNPTLKTLPELRSTRWTIRWLLQRYPFTSPSLTQSLYIYNAYVFVFLLNFIYIFLDLEMKICVSLTKATWIMNFLSYILQI